MLESVKPTAQNIERWSKTIYIWFTSFFDWSDYNYTKNTLYHIFRSFWNDEIVNFTKYVWIWSVVWHKLLPISHLQPVEIKFFYKISFWSRKITLQVQELERENDGSIDESMIHRWYSWQRPGTPEPRNPDPESLLGNFEMSLRFYSFLTPFNTYFNSSTLFRWWHWLRLHCWRHLFLNKNWQNNWRMQFSKNFSVKHQHRC
jgi:hypothetical protein